MFILKPVLRGLHARRHLPSKKRVVVYRNRLRADIRPVFAANPLAPMEFADGNPICCASFDALPSKRVFAVSVLPVCHHLFLANATC